MGGSQRAFRLTLIFLVALVALYGGFYSYARTAPGGNAPAASNGLLLFTAIFGLFAAVGTIYTLTSAPRGVEIRKTGVTVVSRWGLRRTYPPLERLRVRVLRRYTAGLLSSVPVELVEIWGEGSPARSYVADASLFAGAAGESGPK